MKCAPPLPLRTIVSVPYIQSQPWNFATEQDRQRFDRAVASLPDFGRVAVDRDIPPASRKLAKRLGLPAGNGLGRVLNLSSKYHLVRHLAGNYGQIALACVLAMSSPEHPIITLLDVEAGAKIVSYLPMTRATWPGKVTLMITAEDEQRVTVEARTTFPGQIVDWFRGRRVVNRTLQEAWAFLADMGARPIMM